MSLEAIKEQLEKHVDELGEQAMAAAERYYRFREETGKDMDWPLKSVLLPRVRKHGNSVTIEWYKWRWFRGASNKNGRKGVAEYIPKPRNTRAYQMSKLLEHAKDWEREMVEQTEKEFAAIRQQLWLVMRARSYIDMAIKEQKKREG